jgi:hypothetical protein
MIDLFAGCAIYCIADLKAEKKVEATNRGWKYGFKQEVANQVPAISPLGSGSIFNFTLFGSASPNWDQFSRL